MARPNYQDEFVSKAVSCVAHFRDPIQHIADGEFKNKMTARCGAVLDMSFGWASGRASLPLCEICSEKKQS